MQNITVEEKQFLAKLQDMIEFTLETSKTRFTNFLSPNLLSLGLESLERNYDIKFMCFGGYDGSERNVLGICTNYEEIEHDAFPICTLKITGKDIKKLNHRDYLGTLMSLGIKREVIGDIALFDDFTLIFVLELMAEYIQTNMKKIGGTGMNCEIITHNAIEAYEPKFEIKEGTVASLRLDSVSSLAFGMSRTKAGGYIKGEKVFLNHRVCNDIAKEVKPNDHITVRGMGRVLFSEISGRTKKDRYYLKIKRYI